MVKMKSNDSLNLIMVCTRPRISIALVKSLRGFKVDCAASAAVHYCELLMVAVKWAKLFAIDI